jgi:hypothetical protein
MAKIKLDDLETIFFRHCLGTVSARRIYINHIKKTGLRLTAPNMLSMTAIKILIAAKGYAYYRNITGMLTAGGMSNYKAKLAIYYSFKQGYVTYNTPDGKIESGYFSLTLQGENAVNYFLSFTREFDNAFMGKYLKIVKETLDGATPLLPERSIKGIDGRAV